MNKFYITTAIPYVNAAPHIGHALEFVQADTVARYHRLKKEETLLLSGSDENALKNVRAAEEAGVPVAQFVNKNAELFQDLARKLNVRFDVFQRGSDKNHHSSSQKLWELCDKAGDIYKSSYEGLYCVGCEAFYAPEELDENQECFEHPGKRLEKVSEENYFFKLSRYQNELRNLIESDELRVVPLSRKNEILAFLKEPLRDISISRSNERAKNWGVPVPGDDSQRIYVWFDALNIYQSGVGFGKEEKRYEKWWPADVHVIGKGITRFHAVYWPAFLLSAGLVPPKKIFVHGYIAVDGKKMSKSLGNVVDPFELIAAYGADPVRYYLLREIPATEDGDFTLEKFKERYNADLADGLGNAASRILKMAVDNDAFPDLSSVNAEWLLGDRQIGVRDTLGELDNFEFGKALEMIWSGIHQADRLVELEKPFLLIRTDEKRAKEIIETLVTLLWHTAVSLEPFLPETAEKLKGQITGKNPAPLFPRLA